MARPDLSGTPPETLLATARDPARGLLRAQAMEELASRALIEPALLPDVVALISSERRMGIKTGPPLGWLAADRLYLSGQERAIAALLRAMQGWSREEQEDLLRHWAGRRGLPALLAELGPRYGYELAPGAAA
jgi:hypothetical protein